MWIGLAILSAFCLGFYDISKKQSLNTNSVVDVLTFSIVISSLLLFPIWLLSRLRPEMMMETLFFVPQVNVSTHLFIIGKSAIVLCSWICAYIALKHLNLSLVSSLQSTRPMWTLLGAVIIFGEVLNGWQWAGVGCAIGSLIIYTLIEQHKNKSQIQTDKRYIIFLILGILFGSASGLYDKYLMRQFDHNAVQVYYTWYQAAMMIMISGFCRFNNRIQHRPPIAFQWRWMIVGISVFLVLSDFFYLLALTYPDSLIAVVSTTRRIGTIIPFLYGILILKEPHPQRKLLCLGGILLGLIFLLIGTL